MWSPYQKLELRPFAGGAELLANGIPLRWDGDETAQGRAAKEVGSSDKPRRPATAAAELGDGRPQAALFDRLRRSADTNAVTEGRAAREDASSAGSAYERLPRALLDVAEGYYAVTMKAATPAELAKMERIDYDHVNKMRPEWIRSFEREIAPK